MSHLKKVKNKKKNLYRAAEYNTAIYQSHFFVVLDVRKKTLRSRIEIKVSIFMLFLVVCILSKLKKKNYFSVSNDNIESPLEDVKWMTNYAINLYIISGGELISRKSKITILLYFSIYPNWVDGCFWKEIKIKLWEIFL